MSKEAMKLALEALEWCHGGEPCGTAEAITALREALAEQPAQQEPEFITHIVEQSYDWSEWVCPDPKGYLMKCCDCGLVHEAEFGVVRYKSETEREDCDMVEDPNLQAVFRMRRSEQWSPEDTANRAGGLPMEQPAQQDPVAWALSHSRGIEFNGKYPMQSSRDEANRMAQQHLGTVTVTPLYTSPPAQRTWVGLTQEEFIDFASTFEYGTGGLIRAIEAKLKEKNT